jgi:hypothetical protein
MLTWQVVTAWSARRVRGPEQVRERDRQDGAPSVPPYKAASQRRPRPWTTLQSLRRLDGVQRLMEGSTSLLAEHWSVHMHTNAGSAACPASAIVGAGLGLSAASTSERLPRHHRPQRASHPTSSSGHRLNVRGLAAVWLATCHVADEQRPCSADATSASCRPCASSSAQWTQVCVTHGHRECAASGPGADCRPT